MGLRRAATSRKVWKYYIIATWEERKSFRFRMQISRSTGFENSCETGFWVYAVWNKFQLRQNLFCFWEKTIFVRFRLAASIWRSGVDEPRESISKNPDGRQRQSLLRQRRGKKSWWFFKGLEKVMVRWRVEKRVGEYLIEPSVFALPIMNSSPFKSTLKSFFPVTSVRRKGFSKSSLISRFYESVKKYLRLLSSRYLYSKSPFLLGAIWKQLSFYRLQKSVVYWYTIRSIFWKSLRVHLIAANAEDKIQRRVSKLIRPMRWTNIYFPHKWILSCRASFMLGIKSNPAIPINVGTSDVMSASPVITHNLRRYFSFVKSAFFSIAFQLISHFCHSWIKVL